MAMCREMGNLLFVAMKNHLSGLSSAKVCTKRDAAKHVLFPNYKRDILLRAVFLFREF